MIFFHSQLHSSLSLCSCFLVLKFSAISFLLKMVSLVNYKDVILSNPNPNADKGTSVPRLVTPIVMSESQNDSPGLSPNLS